MVNGREGSDRRDEIALPRIENDTCTDYVRDRNFTPRTLLPRRGSFHRFGYTESGWIELPTVSRCVRMGGKLLDLFFFLCFSSLDIYADRYRTTEWVRNKRKK